MHFSFLTSCGILAHNDFFNTLSHPSKSLSFRLCFSCVIWSICDCHILIPSLPLSTYSFSAFYYFIDWADCLSHSALLLCIMLLWCLLYRVGTLYLCCTFTLYISFSLTGWLMHWLLITKAVSAEICKYMHSCTSRYLSPPRDCWGVKSHSGLKLCEKWVVSPDPLSDRDCMKNCFPFMDMTAKNFVGV